MTITCTKYHGIGNDFLLFEDFSRSFPLHSQLMRQLCHRQFGIGADGVILVRKGNVSDISIDIFNANGSRPSMCGNGLRCAAHFAARLLSLEEPSSLTIASAAAIHTCTIDKNIVSATLSLPTNLRSNWKIPLGDSLIPCAYVNTGVPHLFFFSNTLDEKVWERYAKSFRFHPSLPVGGANVNFARLLSSNRWSIRTYERGVEEETLACGTAAAALAVICFEQEKSCTHFQIVCRSNKELEIALFSENGLLKRVEMRGAVCPVFETQVDLNRLRQDEYISLYT